MYPPLLPLKNIVSKFNFLLLLSPEQLLISFCKILFALCWQWINHRERKFSVAGTLEMCIHKKCQTVLYLSTKYEIQKLNLQCAMKWEWTCIRYEVSLRHVALKQSSLWSFEERQPLCFEGLPCLPSLTATHPRANQTTIPESVSGLLWWARRPLPKTEGPERCQHSHHHHAG